MFHSSTKINHSGKRGFFINPILSGFYPDPSICKVDKNFYLINSTFAYFPCIPIFHSKDLVNWKQIGNVFDRPGQINLEGMGVSRAIFAPSIRFYNGLFYITCTLIDGGNNFIVTAENPAGPWSDPVWLPHISGIDPSMFFDDDGRSYIIYNRDAPEGKPLYEGHRTIRINDFDCDKLASSEENTILINGGVDISKKPVWIEGPHIFKENGFYYLSAAEGGTCENHSQVVFKSASVKGPYVPYEKNPILTQRRLDPRREFAVTSTGHADFVKLDNGDWWVVFLGCRPYEPSERNFYNTGRETFLTPVKWLDGWPVINPDFEEVRYCYPLPMKKKGRSGIPLNGNFTIREYFDIKKLPMHWLFLRVPEKQWFKLNDKKCLKMQLLPVTVSGKSNPAFIGRRQQHLNCYASVCMDFEAKNESEKSGLVIFQNEEHFYYLCKSKKDGNHSVELYRSGNKKESGKMELLSQLLLKDPSSVLYLKIGLRDDKFSFYYSLSGNDWISLKDDVDATFLSTNVAGGFVGCIFAMYSTSLGIDSDNAAFFKWFEYCGEDEIYKTI
jgi:xylan 1,4-beta-xylosidase